MTLAWGRAIATLRARRGMRQCELAEALDWHTAYLSRIENGATLPLADLEQIAAALRVPVWLLAMVAGDGEGVPARVAARDLLEIE